MRVRRSGRQPRSCVCVSTPALIWAVVAGAFAVQFRPEAVLVAPVIVLVIAVFAPAEFRQPRFWWAGALALVLLTVHLGHLAAVRNEGWGSGGPKFSLDYLRAQSAVERLVLPRAMPGFPPCYSILAGRGVAEPRACGARRLDRHARTSCSSGASFWFFTRAATTTAPTIASPLMTYPPLAVLAGIGTFWSCRAARSDRLAAGCRRDTRRWRSSALQFLWYLPFVRSTGEEAWGARADVEFAKVAAGDLPRNSFVLTHNPGMFHLWGVSAGQASIASSEAGYAANVLVPRYAGGVFFHWNFWCNVADPLQQAFCTDILQRFPHTLVREQRERNYRYALSTGSTSPPRTSLSGRA